MAAPAAASSPLTTHALLLQTVKFQAEQLQGVALPELHRRLGAVEGREEENEAAIVEARGAVERAQAMLTAHRSETERLLAMVKSMGSQLAEAKAGHEEAKGEVEQHKERIESLEAALRDRDASMHEVRGQNRELLRQLAMVSRQQLSHHSGDNVRLCTHRHTLTLIHTHTRNTQEKTTLRSKEDETTTLLHELSAARQRAVELSFKCNEASYSSSQARQEMLRLGAEVQALKVRVCGCICLSRSESVSQGKKKRRRRPRSFLH